MNIKKRNSKRDENQQAMYTHLEDFHYCSFCIAWTNDNLAPQNTRDDQTIIKFMDNGLSQ